MTDSSHFSEAMASLARIDVQNQQQAARTASAPPKPKPAATASVPALDSDPHEVQNRREGAALLAAMGRAGVTGEKWHSTTDLMGGQTDER